MNEPQAIPLAPPLPLARTDTANVFGLSQTLAAQYNFVTGSYLQFLRPNAMTPSGLRWFTANDPIKGNYISLEMDVANGGHFLPFYVPSVDEDVLEIGCTVNPNDGLNYSGRFKFGRDALKHNTTISVHDLDPDVQWSLSTWSQHNGFLFNSKVAAADGFVVQRDDTPEQHWFAYHQGAGTYDWRWGMAPNSYDLVFYSGTGQPTSPADPGTEIFRLSHDGTLTNKTVADLAARVAALEAKLSKT